MDFSAICRLCLGNATLNPIFVNNFEEKCYSSAVLITTGIKITPNDGLPQQICIECIDFLNQSLKYRKKCKEAEEQLLKCKNTIKVSEIKPLLTVQNFKIAKINSGKSTIQSASNTIKSKSLPKGIEAELSDDKKHLDDAIKIEKIKYKLELEDDDKPLKYLITSDSENSNTSNNMHLTIIEESDQAIYNTPPKPTEDEDDNLKIEFLDNTDQLEVPYEIDTLAETNQNRVICKICNKSLSKHSIDSHMATQHPGKDGRKVKCDLCDKYIIKQKMNRHKIMMHGVSYEESACIRCGYCKSEFDNKDLLMDHVASCKAKKKKWKIPESGREIVNCDVCDKAMQRASLRMHKAIKHAGLGPVCEHCGRRFGNKFRLNEHYRAKHGYDKFKCSTCDFQSASALAMKNHERRHRGEKPFVCESCGAKFHAAYLLAQHRQSHRTERLVKCDLCPASFKANNSLHMHKLTCHSRALYQCALCARRYRCRHYVVKHLRHFHAYRGVVPRLLAVDDARAPVEALAAGDRPC